MSPSAPCSTRQRPAQAVDATAFKDLFRRHPAGVAIVTLQGPDGPVGFTATSVISVSAEPAFLAFSITQVSSSYRALMTASSAVVSFLAHDQAELSVQFATSGIDRFADQRVEYLPTGEPRLADVDSWARIELTERVAAGSSLLVVGQVTDLEDDGAADPGAPARLVYVDRTYHRANAASQIAP